MTMDNKISVHHVLSLTAIYILSFGVIFASGENENPPVFNSSYYSESVLENVANYTLVVTVTATDADNSSTPEGTVYYEIIDSNDNYGFFDITSDSGEIRTNGIIDREKQEYVNMTVAAFDNGDPQKNDTVDVDIRLLDVNDNQPVITPKNMNTSIPENSPVETFVVDVNVTDPDIEGELIYSLNPTADAVRQYFHIDSSTGVITTAKLFDNTNTYILTVDVKDGNPDHELSYGHVLVDVYYSDSNDPNQHDPQFHKDSYKYYVPPDLPVSSNLTDYGDTIIVVDKDAGENGEVICTLDSESNTRSIFAITEDTCVIYTMFPLEEDYERYDLIVIGTDKGKTPRSSEVAAIVYVVEETQPPPAQSDCVGCWPISVSIVLLVTSSVLVVVVIVQCVVHNKRTTELKNDLKQATNVYDEIPANSVIQLNTVNTSMTAAESESGYMGLTGDHQTTDNDYIAPYDVTPSTT